MDGLTKEEVKERVKKGQINTEVDSKTKSTKDIILSNTINYFNILNIILAILILFSGQIKNILFLIVVVCNSSITIFQEIRSKRMVECLTLLSKNKITVLRDGKKEDINTNEIVLDDVLFVETGEQLPVDCIILDGHLEMDESNLTGESETVDKNKDDEVYSGSIVVSGTAKLLVKKVGMDSYTNKISSSAKVDRKYPSKLRDTMDGILKIVTIAIIPVGVLIFLKNKFIFKLPFEDLILKSTAPLVGMIPEGLILLTSVALAVSVYNLGKKKILIQQLYCTESLARVDVLCVDKTGTITEG
ncbi:HAD-IC family P-type ATPase, partial [Helcococcus kunzii]|uniref:HAD-IC family P-type ATPase n=1 Tax=Helcococcus kunzii TaxID=40091 RepID=UPI0024AE44DD